MQFGISGETNQEPQNNNMVLGIGGMDEELRAAQAVSKWEE